MKKPKHVLKKEKEGTYVFFKTRVRCGCGY